MKFSKDSNALGRQLKREWNGFVVFFLVLAICLRLNFAFYIFCNAIVNIQHSVVVVVAVLGTVAEKYNVFIFIFNGDKWFESISVVHAINYAIISQLFIESYSVNAHSIHNHLPMRRP